LTEWRLDGAQPPCEHEWPVLFIELSLITAK
jgi:hypothetical protein